MQNLPYIPNHVWEVNDFINHLLDFLLYFFLKSRWKIDSKIQNNVKTFKYFTIIQNEPQYKREPTNETKQGQLSCPNPVPVNDQ